MALTSDHASGNNACRVPKPRPWRRRHRLVPRRGLLFITLIRARRARVPAKW